MEKKLWKHVLAVRSQSPLVHNITNYVVMNNTANALLAVGASPIMAHAKSEVQDMVTIAGSLVINIGTLDEYWAEAMIMAAQTACTLGKQWVLDPVGAGASNFRDEVLEKLLQFRPTVIRGNASEIIALAKANQTPTKGVDSTAVSNEAVNAGHHLRDKYGAVVCISGALDFVISQNQTITIANGHPLMTKVTGLGCSESAIMAAFVSVTDNKLEAAAAAMALMGIAGELAEQESDGPATLQLKLIDKLYNITEQEFLSRIKIIQQ